MNKHLIVLGIAVLLICVGLSGCNQSDEPSSNEEWHVIDTMSGFLYNGTVSTSVTFSENFDGKVFNISRIIADEQYHYIAYMKIMNTGTLFEDISIDFIGPMVLYNYKETSDELKQLLNSGERPDVDDISMKIFIDDNSTENDNYITFSSSELFYNFNLGIIAPGEEISLYFYIKSYSETLSGEYKTLSEIEVNPKASPAPIFDPNFELFDITDSEFIFNLDFILVLSSDVSLGNIMVSYPNCEMCQPLFVTPISPKKSNYRITINLNVDGDSFRYPFDKYFGVIEINAVNKLNTKYINRSLEDYTYSKTTKDWSISVYANESRLYFTFERNHEQNVFWLLFSINLILILLGIVIITSKWKEIKLNKKLFSDYLPSLNFFPWISLIFFGLNYIVFYSPTINNIGNWCLSIMIITLFSLMVICKKFENGNLI